MVNKEQVYADTVEIVKSAVGSACEENCFLNSCASENVADFIKAVYEALTEINK